MKKILLLLIVFLPGFLYSQNYSILLIPDSLKQNANAVKRFEELSVQIKSSSKAIVKHKWAITILNEAGDKYASFVVPYNKFREVNSMEGILYNQDGKEIKHLKKKDIEDVTGNNDGSLIEDTRLKACTFYSGSYPYTVYFESETEFNGIFILPRWLPISNEKLAVQNSRFIVEIPNEYHLRYKQTNFDSAPIIIDGKTTTYEWKLQNSTAVLDEIFSPDWEELVPMISVAPSEFEYGGYRGSMSTWQEMGKFIYALYEGRSNLPDNIKQDIHVLTNNLNSNEEKIKTLYEYLQKNTRYISIQLGISGLQPFEASYVATKKYGDCKALSNYMVSLLREIGINAYPVIIKSGKGETRLMQDFPSNQFDHVVMCIPGKDTTWLECTSQTESYGYMGTFTGNRQALLIDNDGGHIVSTPSYTVNDNLQLRNINATIDPTGNLVAEVKTHFTCEQQETPHALIHEFNNEQRQRYLNQVISLPTYKVEASDYKEQKGKKPSVDEYLKITAPNYASISGKRLFLQPNLFNKVGGKLSTEKPRKFDIKLDMSYRDIDTIFIAVPDGYEAESLPKDVSLQSEWGKYSVSFKVSGNKISVLRISERYAGTYPASDYPAFAKYMEDIYKADRSKIVLVKKE